VLLQEKKTEKNFIGMQSTKNTDFLVSGMAYIYDENKKRARHFSCSV